VPKIVDVDERRRQIANALWQVADRDGLAAASVRAVADQAGISAGALRHYFPNQDDLLHFAMNTIDQHVRTRVAELEPDPDPVENALRLLMLTEPGDPAKDPEGTLGVRIWFAFSALAMTRPTLSKTLREAHLAVRGACEAAVHRIAPDHRDPEGAVDTLHALVDGLALHGAHSPDLMPTSRIEELLRTQLRSLAG